MGRVEPSTSNSDELRSAADAVANWHFANSAARPPDDALAVLDDGPRALDLHASSAEELRLAGVYTRSCTTLQLHDGYRSDQDDSETDEDGGYLQTEWRYHDNGAMSYYRTFARRHRATDVHASAPDAFYERLVEEKHFDPSGVCRVDVHFALGQPYLYRKHYHPNQRLKSERMFFVEDEESMRCRKAGHWRTYYDSGNVQSEIVYNKDGVRCGFCKRYGPDGTVEWVKDYSREQQE